MSSLSGLYYGLQLCMKGFNSPRALINDINTLKEAHGLL